MVDKTTSLPIALSRVLSAIIVASRVTFRQFAGSPSSPLHQIREVEATGKGVQKVKANQCGEYKKNRQIQTFLSCTSQH